MGRSGVTFSDYPARIQHLEHEASRPELWVNPEEASKLIRELSRLQREWDKLERCLQRRADVTVALELSMDEEAADTLKEIENYLNKWETERLLSGFYDENDAILTLLAGAGGMESQAWANSLLQMYRSWAEIMGYKVSLTECSSGSMSGIIKSATLLIEGRYAYGYLKQERGNHRIQRISPFGNGKRHTSFAGVEVIPLIEEAEFELDLNELEISTCRSGGKGGQNVNKLETAVRVVHLPSGTQVRCEEQRTQHQNKQRALSILRAKLAVLEQQRLDLHLREIRGEQFGTGFGSRIRTYSFDPYKLIKDDRTGMETRNVDDFMAGDREEIGAFIRASLLFGSRYAVSS